MHLRSGHHVVFGQGQPSGNHHVLGQIGCEGSAARVRPQILRNPKLDSGPFQDPESLRVPPATVGPIPPAKVNLKVLPVVLPAVSPVEQEQARLVVARSRVLQMVTLNEAQLFLLH